MLARLITLVLSAALLLASPAIAAGSSPANIAGKNADKLLFSQQGSAMAEVQSMSEVPLGFTSSAGQAVLAAEHTPTLQALHVQMHPLKVYPYVWRAQHPYWYVLFLYHGKIVASVNVSRAGKALGAWTGSAAIAPYAHGGFSWSVSNWIVLVPAAILFMLPFLDPRRLRRIAHLDALAVLAFLVSWVVLAQAHLEMAVWLAYPPLVYLLWRLLRLGFGHGQSSGRLAPLLSVRTMLIGLPLILAARITLSFLGHQEIDVGYQSVAGAFRIVHHLPIYLADPNHGDTYGPITYLSYVPFELIFPWTGSFSDLHAADAAAILFDLGTMVGLGLLGRQLREGRQGTRLGLVLAWAWAACPFTIIGLTVHTNDALVSMLSVFALLALRSPLISGGLLGLAAAAKFSPAGLLPLLAAPRQRGRRGTVICAGSFTAVTVLAIYSWLPARGFSYFWQRTVGFQMHRVDVFSPWALHPDLRPLQIVLMVLAIAIAGAVALVPAKRSLVATCALAGAVTIAIQLAATHWYFYYIMWFAPFALVAFLGGGVHEAVPAAEPSEPDWVIQPTKQREPAMAGA